jgi:hypothetical protein
MSNYPVRCRRRDRPFHRRVQCHVDRDGTVVAPPKTCVSRRLVLDRQVPPSPVDSVERILSPRASPRRRGGRGRERPLSSGDPLLVAGRRSGSDRPVASKSRARVRGAGPSEGEGAHGGATPPTRASAGWGAPAELNSRSGGLNISARRPMPSGVDPRSCRERHGPAFQATSGRIGGRTRPNVRDA